MVRIDRNRRSSSDLRPAGERGSGSRVEKGTSSQFERDLLAKQDEFRRKRLQQLLEEIDDLAARLLESVSVGSLMSYRRAIRDFLREATASAFHLRQERGWSRRGGHSVLLTVQKMNAELEELLRDFAGRSSPPSDLLKTLDKIRGLLVDLMV